MPRNSIALSVTLPRLLKKVDSIKIYEAEANEAGFIYWAEVNKLDQSNFSIWAITLEKLFQDIENML